MKRLIIIVEGQTEKEFVENSLRKFFNSKGIFDVRAIMIQTSKGNKGGFVNYDHLKNDITNLLKSEKNILVSMFVDFFRIPTSFPNFELSISKSITDAKIEVLLEGISKDINDTRFIPYIQKHEFEALLFSSNEGFSNWFENEWVIQVLHDNEYISLYKNNTRLLKQTGDYVKAGESIAITGSEGDKSSNKFFYFEIWKKGNPINPQDMITFRF